MNGENERPLVPSGKRLVSEAMPIASVCRQSGYRRVLARCHESPSPKWFHQNDPAPSGSGSGIVYPVNTDRRPVMTNL